MKKSELINWLEGEYRQWQGFVEQIEPMRITQPSLAGDWSFKDLVAHLNGWQPKLIAGIRAAQRGEPEPPPPWPAHLEAEDDINAWIYEANRERTMSEVLDETQRAFQELIAVIEGLPEDVRIDEEWRLVHLGGKRFPAGEFFDHFHDDHEPDVRAWLEQGENHRGSMNINTWRTILWQQYGAAIDMLDNALRACPDELWLASLWDDPSERPEYSQFWFLGYHTLYWLDLFLTGGKEGFAPPAFITMIWREEGRPLPARPYTKDELQAYLDHGRKKCQATLEALTDEAAQRRCRFSWMEVSFAELQLYCMRHVQEHAAQLSLFLGQKTGSAPDWEATARSSAA